MKYRYVFVISVGMAIHHAETMKIENGINKGMDKQSILDRLVFTTDVARLETTQRKKLTKKQIEIIKEKVIKTYQKETTFDNIRVELSLEEEVE